MSKPKILAFSGSTRAQSFNQKLVTHAAKAAEAAGAEVNLINLRDFPMPLFSEDLEAGEGTPLSARAFKDLLIAADGLLIATPEYNSTITPTLKNAIDWASREAPNEPMLAAFKGKKAALLSASPSQYGGVRSLGQLRQLFSNIQVEVLEEDFSLPSAHEAFDDDGELGDKGNRDAVAKVVSSLVDSLS